MSKEVAEDLRAAKALINTPAKWRKDAGDGHTCWCASTACKTIAVRSAKNASWTSRWSRMGDALVRQFPEGFPAESIPDFNDNPATTHADIMRLFDDAIAAEERAE
jgi:hypothetical protein